MELEELQQQQGWTDSTILELALEWLEQNGHFESFMEDLQERAKEENAETSPE